MVSLWIINNILKAPKNSGRTRRRRWWTQKAQYFEDRWGLRTVVEVLGSCSWSPMLVTFPALISATDPSPLELFCKLNVLVVLFLVVGCPLSLLVTFLTLNSFVGFLLDGVWLSPSLCCASFIDIVFVNNPELQELWTAMRCWMSGFISR